MEELNPKQELFCQYYTQVGDTFGNGTQSYAEAYEYNLDTLSKDNAIWSRGEKGERLELISDSSYARAYNTCAAQGSRMLRKSNIQARITALLAQKMTEEFVDSQLMKVIVQDEDKAPKVAAIREFNKLKQRIVEKVDVTSKGEQVFRQMSDEELYAISGRGGQGTSA